MEIVLRVGLDRSPSRGAAIGKPILKPVTKIFDAGKLHLVKCRNRDSAVLGERSPRGSQFSETHFSY